MKPIYKVEAFNRRQVNEEEAIGLLNISRAKWEKKVKPHAKVYVGGNYNIEQLYQVLDKFCVEIDPNKKDR